MGDASESHPFSKTKVRGAVTLLKFAQVRVRACVVVVVVVGFFSGWLLLFSFRVRIHQRGTNMKIQRPLRSVSSLSISNSLHVWVYRTDG